MIKPSGRASSLYTLVLRREQFLRTSIKKGRAAAIEEYESWIAGRQEAARDENARKAGERRRENETARPSRAAVPKCTRLHARSPRIVDPASGGASRRTGRVWPAAPCERVHPELDPDLICRTRSSEQCSGSESPEHIVPSEKDEEQPPPDIQPLVKQWGRLKRSPQEMTEEERQARWLKLQRQAAQLREEARAKDGDR